VNGEKTDGRNDGACPGNLADSAKQPMKASLLPACGEKMPVGRWGAAL